MKHPRAKFHVGETVRLLSRKNDHYADSGDTDKIVDVEVIYFLAGDPRSITNEYELGKLRRKRQATVISGRVLLTALLTR